MNKIAENISQRELDSYLTDLSKQPGGLDKIASLALQPVMEDVLYESKARQIFAQKVLDPGEEAVLDGDVRVLLLHFQLKVYLTKLKQNLQDSELIPARYQQQL